LPIVIGDDRAMKILPLYLLYAIGYSAVLSQRGFRGGPVSISRRTEKKPERVLIVGATGGTGRQLVSQALERGYTATAFVRTPSKLRIEHERLRIAQGDVLDYATVEAAMREQDAVLSALGHRKVYSLKRIQSDGIANVLRAMKAHNVPRLICETALGIGNAAGRLGLIPTLTFVPLVLPIYFWDKARQEELIAASDREWVIVRPGILLNRPKRGSYRHGPNVGSYLWLPRISRADVADFMLNQLTSDAYLGAAPGISW
jgi:putative NADH-flavin reductase